VERLIGPHLLPVTKGADPTHYVRRFLTAALGMPIDTAEREAVDAQGTVTLFFHENKDRHGDPSNKVFGISNCHVLRKHTTVDYKFKGTGAPPQYVRLAGFRRFQRGLDKIRTRISDYGSDAELLAREIAELEVKLGSEDPEVATVIAHDFRTSFLLCLYIFLDSFTLKPPHSFISHLISRHQDCIQLLREIDKDKMGIYKGINHALYLCLETHGFSELSIGRPSKDIIPKQDPLHLVSTRRTMLWQLP